VRGDGAVLVGAEDLGADVAVALQDIWRDGRMIGTADAEDATLGRIACKNSRESSEAAVMRDFEHPQRRCGITPASVFSTSLPTSPFNRIETSFSALQ